MARAPHTTWYNWYANNCLARELEALAKPLAGSLVIDVGCGDQPYRAMLAGFERYIGFDAPGRPESRGKADAYGDAGALPFASACADAVLCTEVMEHVPDPDAMLAEIRRVLKPGGALLLSVPFIWRIHEEPRDYWRFTEYGLRLIVERAGMRVESLTATDGYAAVVLQARAHFLYHASGKWKPLVRPLVWLFQAVAQALRPFDRNRRMVSNYVVLARKA